jgi:hypothetical protein
VLLLVLLAFFVKDLVYWWGWWMPFMIAWLGITLAWRLFLHMQRKPISEDHRYACLWASSHAQFLPSQIFLHPFETTTMQYVNT